MLQSTPPSHSNDPGLGPTIGGVSWALTAVAVLAVVIRILVRYRGPSKLGIDDLVIVVALVGPCLKMDSSDELTLIYHLGSSAHLHGICNGGATMGRRQARRGFIVTAL